MASGISRQAKENNNFQLPRSSLQIDVFLLSTCHSTKGEGYIKMNGENCLIIYSKLFEKNSVFVVDVISYKGILPAVEGSDFAGEVEEDEAEGGEGEGTMAAREGFPSLCYHFMISRTD